MTTSTPPESSPIERRDDYDNEGRLGVRLDERLGIVQRECSLKQRGFGAWGGTRPAGDPSGLAITPRSGASAGAVTVTAPECSLLEVVLAFPCGTPPDDNAGDEAKRHQIQEPRDCA